MVIGKGVIGQRLLAAQLLDHLNTVQVVIDRSSSIVMTLPNGLRVVSVMAAPFLLAWLRLATLRFSQIRSRHPYSNVRNILYVIKDGYDLACGLRNDEGSAALIGYTPLPIAREIHRRRGLFN
jgi:hypothetical protein